MLNNFLLVGLGSFLGGGLRYLVAQFVRFPILGSFPIGTFVVNVLGCFLIGIFSSLPSGNGGISASTRLLLTTGMCGGFTTFSTFMKEAIDLQSNQLSYLSILYLMLSVACGGVAVVAGRQLVLFFR